MSILGPGLLTLKGKFFRFGSYDGFFSLGHVMLESTTPGVPPPKKPNKRMLTRSKRDLRFDVCFMGFGCVRSWRDAV